MISSVALRTQPLSSPFFMYLARVNFWSFHTSPTFLSSLSIVSSLVAAFVISEMTSAKLCNSIENRF